MRSLENFALTSYSAFPLTRSPQRLVTFALTSPKRSKIAHVCLITLKITPAKRDVLVVAQLCQFAGDGASRCILRGGLPPKSSNFPPRLRRTMLRAADMEGGCRASAPPCAPQNRNQWSTRSRGILETTAPTSFAKILGNLLKPGHDLVQVISQEGTHCVQHAFNLIC